MTSISTQKGRHDTPDKAADSALPVVGIGASAGGLEALQTFFSNLSPHTGFAFIVVTHQQPGHISLLPDLLKNFTDMPVLTAQDGMFLKRDHVFVCPPGKNLALLNRRLHLMDSPKHNSANLPIDYFLRSLAEDIQEMGVGIILSGTGTDGTLGLKAIKGVSGMTMVQEPKTAKFDGMPSSAIAMGDVDFVLPAEKMGLLPARAKEGLRSSFKSFSTEFQTGNIARQIERLLLDRYAPVSEIINEHGKIISINDRTGKYLEPSTAQPSWNIIEMARVGLCLPLLSSLRLAAKKGETEIISSLQGLFSQSGFASRTFET